LHFGQRIPNMRNMVSRISPINARRLTTINHLWTVIKNDPTANTTQVNKVIINTLRRIKFNCERIVIIFTTFFFLPLPPKHPDIRCNGAGTRLATASFLRCRKIHVALFLSNFFIFHPIQNKKASMSRPTRDIPAVLSIRVLSISCNGASRIKKPSAPAARAN